MMFAFSKIIRCQLDNGKKRIEIHFLKVSLWDHQDHLHVQHSNFLRAGAISSIYRCPDIQTLYYRKFVKVAVHSLRQVPKFLSPYLLQLGVQFFTNRS